MKSTMMVLFSFVLVTSISQAASADFFRIYWNDTGSWSRDVNGSLGDAYNQVLDVGAEHCAEVAAGSPTDNPNGLNLTTFNYSQGYVFQYYYSCN